MKFYLVGINAKYIHTALAIRSIERYCKLHYDISLHLGEFTINQREEDILEELYTQDADVYFFSCYIWNIQYVKHLASQLVKIRPDAKIFFGGPEATYKGKELIDELDFLQGVILGEGEETAGELSLALANSTPLEDVFGLYLRGGKTQQRPPLDMDKIPFSYVNLESFHGRILYYESMRGCPFSCSYCLSSVEKGVQMKSLAIVTQDLQLFLDENPRQVKFVDRTFNCNTKRANAIWEYLIQNDNGVTNFHFEIAGDLLNKESLTLLSTARLDLFQFEIGVQSTNKKTLQAIQRTTNLEKLSHNVKELHRHKNIHLHLDLIAGLPYEDYSSFIDSFHWVYALEPHALQLGFLKVLGGSQMEADVEKFGLIYSDFPPFQVLKTRWLSYEDLLSLQGVEYVLDAYRNSGRFQTLTTELSFHFSTPFDFYHKLWNHYSDCKGEGPLSKLGYYEILGSFATLYNIPHTEYLKALCRYDIMSHEKPRKYPQWAEKHLSSKEKEWVWNFYQSESNIHTYLKEYMGTTPKQFSRLSHVELFNFNPENLEDTPTAVIFNYRNRDITGSATKHFLPLDDSFYNQN